MFWIAGLFSVLFRVCLLILTCFVGCWIDDFGLCLCVFTYLVIALGCLGCLGFVLCYFVGFAVYLIGLIWLLASGLEWNLLTNFAFALPYCLLNLFLCLLVFSLTV